MDGLRLVCLGILGAWGWSRAAGLDRSLWGFGAWALALCIAIPGSGLLFAGLEAVIRVLALAGVVMLVRREEARSWVGWLVGALVLQALIGIAQRVGFDPLAAVWGLPAAIQESHWSASGSEAQLSRRSAPLPGPRDECIVPCGPQREGVSSCSHGKYSHGEYDL